MDTEVEACRGPKSSKRRRKEDSSFNRIGDKLATAEIEQEEEKRGEKSLQEHDDVYMDEELREEEDMAESEYRECWNKILGGGEIDCFEDETATPGSLQVYSIKVKETKLMWPLHIYGMVAARDCVDYNRNILFSRQRDNCQIIIEKDPCLLLTGPSRAIVYLDPVYMEIQLKVKKGESESEDEALIHKSLAYNGSVGPFGTNWSNDLCTISLHFRELFQSVQATFMSLQVVSGSCWPTEYGWQVVCRAHGDDDEFVLLDFPDGTKKMPLIDADGYLVLSRRIVSVELDEDMMVSVNAYSACTGDIVASGDVVFKPHRSNIVRGTCHLGNNCVVEIVVAWSLGTSCISP